MLANTITEAERLLYTTTQACEVLSLSRTTLYREMKRGALRGIVCGEKVRRITRAELERYAAARQAEAATATK